MDIRSKLMNKIRKKGGKKVKFVGCYVPIELYDRIVRLARADQSSIARFLRMTLMRTTENVNE